MAHDQQEPQPSNQNSTHKAGAERQDNDMSTAGRIPGQNDPDAKASGNPEAASTQENMGDGTGIRGAYGNSSQTNGAEGTSDADAEGNPTKKTDQWAE
ncbi:hypothetical protein [Hymenobacter psychrotolerans]|uniref:Uncharacterized protein n=1 Tax=Hymenobacter psychrotolerans DSM 18569 TaxID=1121959 RepID=A0A1M6WTN4_9BACT|nr:hypothetical protein [Hymenobacter psychrotolerans]SHK97093.1 hypothetical protein SAMN02746009_01896 [Hymenobacter psychrotolerans DSM 18569]